MNIVNVVILLLVSVILVECAKKPKKEEKVWGNCLGTDFENSGTVKDVALRQLGVAKKCSRKPCILKKGTTQVISIWFTPNHDAKKLSIKVEGKLRVMGWFPFPFGPTDACKKNHIRGGCPLKANVPKKFQMKIKVSRFYPKIRLPVRIQLRDEQNRVAACVKIPVAIR